MEPDLSLLEAYQARPGQSAQSHLRGVATNGTRLLPVGAESAYGDDWQAVMRALAWTHDAGKLTTYFQQYLETGTRSHAPRDEYTYHGFVSALLAAHVLYSMDVSAAMRTAGFYAVARHHGVLPTAVTAHDEYAGCGRKVDSRYDIPQAQLQDIDQNAAPAADALITAASDGQMGWDDVFTDRPATYQQLLTDPKELNEQFYETLLRAWSTLVCADKLDAAGIGVSDSPQRPELTQFRAKIDELPAGHTPRRQTLDQLRSAAHEEAYQQLLTSHREGQRLFQLTLPTGFGKTLTGLRAAIELAEERNSRAIYALPYTSILDQVDDVCQQYLNVDPLSDRYTVHHHLADTRTTLTESKEGRAVSSGSDSLYAETWQSGLVLTTFTQLFESVAGPGNTQSMKLPALQDSVIVLDEPQGISLDWWNLVGRLAAFLNREYDATIIMMTATQPQIFEQSPHLPSPTSLTSVTDECVSFLEANPRVVFNLHDTAARYLAGDASSTLSYEAAAETLNEGTEPGNTTLAVVNTIESAGALTDAVFEQSPPDQRVVPLGGKLEAFYQSTAFDVDNVTDEVADAYLEFVSAELDTGAEGIVVLTLTTRLRPRDRKLLLAVLRQLLDEETATPFDEWSVITLSTQLIEAGVDVSFDRLYRDFAPVPALVQAAGRCNREFGDSTSPVTIWRLASPDQETAAPPSALIYGQRSLLRPARQALTSLREEHGTAIPEAALISTGVEAYYGAVHHQRRTADRSDRLVEYFDSAAGDSLRQASLIDDDYATQDVVVLCSADDRQQYEEYQDLRAADRFDAAKAAFEALKPLIVTVRVDDESDQTDQLLVRDTSAATTEYDTISGRGIGSSHSE
jgi:CRISPR-associated endonuclease Cas3-HD